MSDLHFNSLAIIMFLLFIILKSILSSFCMKGINIIEKIPHKDYILLFSNRHNSLTFKISFYVSQASLI